MASSERAQIRAIVQGIERCTEKAVAKITLDVTANLVEMTPVDTGWARNNWVPSIGVPREESAGSPDNVAAAFAGQEAGKAEVAGYRLEQGKVFVSNNVPYIQTLNNGHSKQAPAGFVQRAARKAVTEDIRGFRC